MKIIKSLVTLGALILLAVTFGCGGSGGGDGSSTGTVSMAITDAKPLLPSGVTNFFVTIDEVLVHSSGGTWKSLPLPQSPNPFTIDLLQFSDGNTTELVPPVALETGKYTQVRLVVGNALLVANGNSYPVTIPSENLKTDKNFDFDVAESAAVDITVDFDLSKSIVVTGTPGSPSYQMKPVLHIVQTDEAATIEGTIANSSFADIGDNPYVVITVIDSTGQEYTKVQVDKDNSATDGKTAYSIFWLVPNQAYTVQINYNPVADDDPNTVEIEEIPDDTVEVPSNSAEDQSKYPDGTLPPGAIYQLNFPLAP